MGAATLMKLLGNYCRNKDIKTAITVGVVGKISCICVEKMIWNGRTEKKVEIESCSSQKNISVISFQVFQMLGKAGVNFMI
jgi:hypothetical protein